MMFLYLTNYLFGKCTPTIYKCHQRGVLVFLHWPMALGYYSTTLHLIFQCHQSMSEGLSVRLHNIQLHDIHPNFRCENKILYFKHFLQNLRLISLISFGVIAKTPKTDALFGTASYQFESKIKWTNQLQYDFAMNFYMSMKY